LKGSGPQRPEPLRFFQPIRPFFFDGSLGNVVRVLECSTTFVLLGISAGLCLGHTDDMALKAI